MTKKIRSVNRRQVLQGVAATGLAAASMPTVFRPAFAVPQTVKIGLVGPRTGALALFYQEMSWAIDAARKVTGNSITINGRKHPLEIVTKDSQSNPNRASEVTQELILNDKVNIVTAFATLEIRQGSGRDVKRHLATIPELLEMHTITGAGDMLCRIVARSNSDLQRVIDALVDFDGIVRTSTVVAMDNPVPYRVLPLTEAATGRDAIR